MTQTGMEMTDTLAKKWSLGIRSVGKAVVEKNARDGEMMLTFTWFGGLVMKKGSHKKIYPVQQHDTCIL